MVFKIKYKQLGGHIHMRVFSAKQHNHTYAKLGDLCCAEEEFAELRAAMSSVDFEKEEA